MFPAVQPSSPLDLLAQGDLVILPSDAAARRLRHSYDQQQQQSCLKAWQPAPVLSWNQWLQSLWSECIVSGSDDRLLLNSAQEHQIWRDIISNSQESGADTLQSADSLAGLAAAAWRLSEAYVATRQLRAHASTHDNRVFAEWAEEFLRVCRQSKYLSQASLGASLAEHIKRGSLNAAYSLCFAGFLEWTPAQEALIAALQAEGAVVTSTNVSCSADEAPERSVMLAENEDDELRAAAVWVHRRLEQHAASGATKQIAVLLPDLDTDRDAVDTIFREVLAPELQNIAADLSSCPYRFSAGKPLALDPMIAAALSLAKWASGPLPISSVSALLLSPYLADPAGLDENAQFDACTLRQSNLLRPDIHLSWLVRLAQRAGFGGSALRWLRPLQTFLASSGNLQVPRSYSDWSEFIRRLVHSASWPGALTSSTEILLAEAWDNALDTIATLDFTGRRVSYLEAFHALERQLASSSHDPATDEAPVHIMRPEDLPGMAFDALVFARATDANWPSAERANPLIDWKLQASLGMPGADWTRAAERTRLTTEAMLASAGTVLFTCAANNGEGKQRLSPVVAKLELPLLSGSYVLASAPLTEHIEPEVLHDTSPLPPLISAQVQGGASVLQHQSACGFRAFAEIRLRAGDLEDHETGMDARERGNVLHNAMGHFWKEARSQSGLRAMSLEEQQTLLATSIEEAFGSSPREDDPWDKAYIALQKQRLTTLLTDWLEYELSRSPFTVLDTERSEMMSVGPLDLNVRVDRIDAVEDGVFLVDYKTGASANPKDWLGERPGEPQLPLYALLPEAGTLAGLAFAKVRAGDSMSWSGYAAADGVLPGRNTTKDLEMLVEDWRTHLTALAEAFAAGEAGVRPKEYPTTCAHCGQRLLCRLDAATLLAVSDTDETAQEGNSRG